MSSSKNGFGWLKRFGKKNDESSENDDELKLNKKLSKLTFNGFLGKIKPREKYIFHSDYYVVDNKYCSILTFFGHDGDSNSRSPFWGISRLVGNINDVECIVIDSINRYPDDWVKSKFKSFEKNLSISSNSDGKIGMLNSNKLFTLSKQGQVIADEVNAGAVYLNIKMKLLVRAKSLEALDKAINTIKTRYKDALPQLTIEAYDGMQKEELSNLFLGNNKKLGVGFDLTSTEFAGMYCLSGKGLNDPYGEYVGNTINDINNVAVMFDVDGFDNTVVLANNHTFDDIECNPHLSDLWCSKISQSAILRGHKVVHVILNNIDMDQLGPKFDKISVTFNLEKGFINPFEMFGKYEDELTVFASHVDKLCLFMSQFMDTKPIPGFNPVMTLKTILTNFYKERGMWTDNPEFNREYIHVVGLKHEDYPILADFIIYLALIQKSANQSNDTMYQQEVKAIVDVFNQLLEVNSDVFGRVSDNLIDVVPGKRRVVYDLSKLFDRSVDIGMASFVNLLGFLFKDLGSGDVVIFHGVDFIKSTSVKSFLNTKIELFRQKKGRIVFSYNSISTMLDDKAFNDFTKANYTILGSMDQETLGRYMGFIGDVLPPALKGSLSSIDNNLLSYIHRGFENSVFNTNLVIDYVSKKKTKKYNS